MTGWTGLLESLHSALIDELVERHPEPKPELAMPVRKSGWELPDATFSQCLVGHVEIDGRPGLTALAFQEGSAKACKAKLEPLWEAILMRAGSEFSRRNIRPVIASRSLLSAAEPLPKGYPSPGRVIWIPVRLDGAAIAIGVGV